MFTGCRTSELLRLRIDAKTRDEPGHVEIKNGTGRLFLRRSKGGVNPFSTIGPEFSKMIECHRRWHDARFPNSPWYFPSPLKNRAITRHTLAHALDRESQNLGVRHITPHGVRSFYVTKRRSDGATDTQIAGEIGDQTTSLMESTYGNRPPNWDGEKRLDWLPEKGLPAWLLWSSKKDKIVRLKAV